MHILVTGGAGFIGSNIVEYLLLIGHKVRVIDNFSTGKNKNISEFLQNSNFEFIYGDITNINDVRKACCNIDAICHQAALGSVSRSINDPLISHNSNVNGFLNILIVAKENGIKRIVYASSSAVYGTDETLHKIENKIGKPLSPYAITKYIDELYAEIFTKLYGMECIGLRYFNVFGPKQDPSGEYAAVIPKFIDLLQKNINPIIYGDGSITRDFIYVSNVVDANYKALTINNIECYGDVFNVGSGENITILEMYNIIKNILNSKVMPIFADNRIGDIEHSTADIIKTTCKLEFSPKINFIEGINKTIKYYANN